MKYRYQLVLQWPATSIDDYDAIIAIEDLLSAHVSGDSSVDGHDAGQGEMNLFILTNAPTKLFAELQPLLADNDRLSNLRAAFRDLERNDFEVLWPAGATTFAVA